MPDEIPDWVEETPHDTLYTLEMYEGTGGSAQEVTLSREEFIELKRHLAAVRGYTAGDAAARVADLSKEIGLDKDATVPADSQQVARYLIAARELYRRCPEAVVCSDEQFAGTLRDLAE